MQIRFKGMAMPAVPVLIALVISLLPVYASAFVPEDLERLKESKTCPGCDLRGADLRGLNLNGANLEGANLLESNLEGASLTGANLEDASCEKANLLKARLDGVKLDGANLDGATWSDGRVCKEGSVGVCK